ncbi:hypothetical protein GF324_01640 [bacterium]|nr:hypothetical protein [bacterium]
MVPSPCRQPRSFVRHSVNGGDDRGETPGNGHFARIHGVLYRSHPETRSEGKRFPALGGCVTLALRCEENPLAVIPARGGSKRFPRKNIAPLLGKPLVVWAIESALEAGIFSHIVLSSDDPEILAAADGIEGVEALPRNASLATDTVQVKHVCSHLLEHYREQGLLYKTFAVLLPTSPLRRASDLRQAWETFHAADAATLMSLVPYSHPPQRAVWAPDGRVKPYFGLEHMVPGQKLETLYRHDGSFIFADSDIFLREGEFYSSDVIPYLLKPEDTADIDSELDLAWVEFLLQRRQLEPKPLEHESCVS